MSLSVRTSLSAEISDLLQQNKHTAWNILERQHHQGSLLLEFRARRKRGNYKKFASQIASKCDLDVRVVRSWIAFALKYPDFQKFRIEYEPIFDKLGEDPSLKFVLRRAHQIKGQPGHYKELAKENRFCKNCGKKLPLAKRIGAEYCDVNCKNKSAYKHKEK